MAQLPRVLIIPAKWTCLNLLFILYHIWLLATPSYQTPPVKCMAAQYRDVKVLIDVVPLLLGLPVLWPQIRRCMLLAILTEYIFQAYRAILLVHMVLKQTFLVFFIFNFSNLVRLNLLNLLILCVDVGILEYRKLADFRLYEIELLVVVMANKLLGRLQRIHLYHDDIRILIWPF
jgi:hypothetical protein